MGTLRHPSTCRPSDSTIFSTAAAGSRGVFGRLRQKRDTGGVATRGGQLEVDHLTEESVRDLNQDARAVTAARLGTLSTAVFKVEQRGDRLVHDVAATTAVHVDDHGHPARVVLVRGVIKPDALGRHTHLTLHQNFLRGYVRLRLGRTRRLRARPASVLSIGCPPGGR